MTTKEILLEAFFDDVNDIITNPFINDDEALEEIEFFVRRYKIQLKEINK
jgi:hypothetical protein